MKYITRESIKKNPDILFVYGDNDLRYGKGGAAKECRGEPNTIGIRVKKKPSTSLSSYYIDKEFKENCRKIDEDIKIIKEKSKDYIVLYIIPNIGKGLARLNVMAPRTYKYLMNRLTELEKDFRGK